jgi:hypothetical protein
MRNIRNEIYRVWLKKGMQNPDLSKPGLADHLTKVLGLEKPMHRGRAYKLMSGTLPFKTIELDAIAQYIEIPVPTDKGSMGSVVMVPFERTIGANIWFEQGTKDGTTGHMATMRFGRYADDQHVAYLFKGDSMAHGGDIKDGDQILCTRYEGEVLHDGNRVVIERTRAGLVEVSARVITHHKDHISYDLCADNYSTKPLVVFSNKGKHASVVVSDTVTIIGIVRMVTRY